MKSSQSFNSTFAASINYHRNLKLFLSIRITQDGVSRSVNIKSSFHRWNM